MATTLLDWISGLLYDPSAREAFQHDPDHYAEEHGFRHLSHADVHDALSLIADGDHSYFGHHFPAPRHFEHGDHDSGAHYLRSYFHDNHDWFTEHNTEIDNSVHQRVDTGDHDRGWNHDRGDDHDWGHDRDWGWDDNRHDGGDFHQVIDNDPVVASGRGSVAAGHDIRDSTLTSGDRNVVGDHNHAVTGDDNTTAFGSGDATRSHLSHVSTGDGGALSVGGDAHGHSTDNDTTTAVHNSGSGSTSVNAAGDHGYADQFADQHEHDDSTRSNYEDHSSNDSHNDFNSHNDAHLSDSHDYDIHHA
jgi:hypothetical protein